MELHPQQARLLRQFSYDHLPMGVRAVSQPFHDVAHALLGVPVEGADVAPDLHDHLAEEGLQFDGPDLTVALRQLLVAKDAAVRAVLP